MSHNYRLDKFWRWLEWCPLWGSLVCRFSNLDPAVWWSSGSRQRFQLAQIPSSLHPYFKNENIILFWANFLSGFLPAWCRRPKNLEEKWISHAPNVCTDPIKWNKCVSSRIYRRNGKHTNIFSFFKRADFVSFSATRSFSAFAAFRSVLKKIS